MDMKTCTKCGEEKLATAEFFYVRETGRLRSDCKACTKKATAANRNANYDCRREYDAVYYANHRHEKLQRCAEWYRANKDQELVRRAAFRAAHPGHALAWNRNYKARKKNASGTHTTEDVRAQHKRQKGCCYWCGVKTGDDYHVDHVTPLSKGGSNGPENIVIACAFCNVSKGAKLPHEFANRQIPQLVLT
jgi:5-methylcytosine-specific restriction endonuclease McrA